MAICVIIDGKKCFLNAQQITELEETKSGIKIKKSHEGLFTEFAKTLGMSVQAAAEHVLANTDKFSAERVKQANFAKNFGGKK